ncbi:helix-turn-helix transcriptional regulator [Tatumella ptyseos]|uniref:helix-turn-helix transcriptional regulator n=1 Tax=Tatumella ptyseos TaxID=82987 RepID=UPI0026EC5835|nr:helix-turn-helix transcriptional regulator [Tatumella ptyseos]WKX27321.1 helix-turn-helix transcriptional regulator [Tatumella ptyseos]
MESLIVRVVGNDAYFKFGIVSLVIGQWREGINGIKIAPDDSTSFHLSFDCREEVVIINLADMIGISSLPEDKKIYWENIYIPFNCRRSTLTQIDGKISRILAVFSWKISTHLELVDLVAQNDLKRYQQLSPTEFRIINLIGQGADCHLIAKKMMRSIKTVRTHYRSACRKLGFDNQADLFRFARYISNNNCGSINTLCL